MRQFLVGLLQLRIFFSCLCCRAIFASEFKLFYGIFCSADIAELAQTKYMIAQDLREGCYSEDIFLLLRESRERRCGAEERANGDLLVCRACLTRVASRFMGFKSDFVGLGG